MNLMSTNSIILEHVIFYEGKDFVTGSLHNQIGNIFDELIVRKNFSGVI